MSAARWRGSPSAGDDEDLGGAGDEIDADFAGEQFLGGGDVDVAGTDDAVGARHGAGAVGEGGDGLRAAHLEDVRDAQQGGGAEDFGHGPCGQATQMLAHARDLRGDDGHHEGGGQRIAAGGDVGGDGIERADDLAELAGRAASARSIGGIWRSA